MSWYRAGSVTVTNGSNIVTGAGTDFVANASIGDAFIGPDGRSYEITQIVSATDLRLTTAYQAATGGGQAYAIQPTQSFARDLALAAAALLNTFAAVRDGAGQGIFAGGSNAAPGVRFSGDQDTGLRSYGTNTSSLVAGGADILIASPTGVTAAGAFVTQSTGDRSLPTARFTGNNGGGTISNLSGLSVYWNLSNGGTESALVFGGTADAYFTIGHHNGSGYSERLRIDGAGNMLVGIASAPEHTITKGAGQGTAVLRVRSNASGALDSFVVASVSAYSPNGAGAAVYLGHSTATGRSLNASGTVNASGADYAEYMLKALGCGIIAKGDVCGVDRDGKLTKTWADAVSFVVKSTDPSLVGGDTWAAHLPPRPDAPGAEPQPPTLPAAPAEDADDAALEAYRDDLAGYPARVAQYQADHAAWDTAQARYDADLAAWEADLEAARICVDRIAFCGQVPCNVSGDFEVGDYIVAAASGAGIKAVAMKPDDITLSQYMRRIGKVWAIRDGRAWIDVQHG